MFILGYDVGIFDSDESPTDAGILTILTRQVQACAYDREPPSGAGAGGGAAQGLQPGAGLQAGGEHGGEPGAGAGARAPAGGGAGAGGRAPAGAGVPAGGRAEAGAGREPPPARQEGRRARQQHRRLTLRRLSRLMSPGVVVRRSTEASIFILIS